jgi:hypothetical protein
MDIQNFLLPTPAPNKVSNIQNGQQSPRQGAQKDHQEEGQEP